MIRFLALSVLVVATRAAANPTDPPAPPPAPDTTTAPAPDATTTPAPPPVVEPAAPPSADTHLANGRALYERGEFGPARDELLAAYTLDHRPELLFALGQVELQLDHFELAIDYYQRFIATNPATEQAALAQQAIGAARARLAERPAPAKPVAPPHREWDIVDSALAAFGSAGVAAGAGLVVLSVELADDHTGSLATYNRRVSRAQLAEVAGIAGLGAGALVVASAFVRWRFHMVDGSVQALATPTSAGLAWVSLW